MSVKLSMCIIAYNNYEDIEAAIASMEKFTSPALTRKLFIVDNGTAVSNASEVNTFKQKIETMMDVEYIDAGSNLGFGRGHNQVIDILDSEYHAIVNPDVLFCEDALSKIVAWMDENREIGMTIPLITDEEGKRQEIYRRELTVFDMFNRMFLKSKCRKRAAHHTMQDMDFSKPFQVPFGQGSFLVIRTGLFKQLGGFDDHYFMYVEDADLCKRVNQISKLMYYPDARVIHKWEKGSHRNKVLFKYHVDSSKYYFRKWGWRLI